MKKYTAWTKSPGYPETLTECFADSAKHFKEIIEKEGSKVVSRVRIKK